ncbi:MAG: arsenate reductase (azurin) small subunit [Planctomycetaceae bacterium]|nr:arsenate reductase (azurin) small subunit [Planctomycetaceae bacterium]
MQEEHGSPTDRPCVSRRRFLLTSSGATVTSIVLASQFSKTGFGEELLAQVAAYERKKVASLRDLKVDTPAPIFYPFDATDLNSLAFIVKLGVPASGGVGPNSDIVAFNTLCTHVGGDLSGTDKTYLKEHKILGPCPLHLTTFDLRRHGMVVAGHATQSLPQVVLEADGNDIYATGILGLIYGKHDTAALPVVI